MNFLSKFRFKEDNGDLTLEGFLASKGFTSAIPFYYSGHGFSVRVDGGSASIRHIDDGDLLYIGTKQEVKQELEILLDKDNRD